MMNQTTFFKRCYSEKLRMLFDILVDKDGVKTVKFQDGVSYSNHELIKIKNLDEKSINNIHELKYFFHGEII